jgi:hypothetical protein
MDLQSVLVTLEQAVVDYQVERINDNNMKIPSKTQAAHKVLLEYRQAPYLFDSVIFILQRTKSPSLKFHVLSSLKDTLSVYSAEYDAIKMFLMEYLYNNHLILENYVKFELLLVLCIMFKLKWDQAKIRAEAMNMIKALVESPDIDRKEVGLNLIIQLLYEFNATKCSNIGMDLQSHYIFKRHFENSEMIEIFLIMLNLCKAIIEHSIDKHSFIDKTLELCSLMLSWDFIEGYWHSCILI